MSLNFIIIIIILCFSSRFLAILFLFFYQFPIVWEFIPAFNTDTTIWKMSNNLPANQSIPANYMTNQQNKYGNQTK